MLVILRLKLLWGRLLLSGLNEFQSAAVDPTGRKVAGSVLPRKGSRGLLLRGRHLNGRRLVVIAAHMAVPRGAVLLVVLLCLLVPWSCLGFGLRAALALGGRSIRRAVHRLLLVWDRQVISTTAGAEIMLVGRLGFNPSTTIIVIIFSAPTTISVIAVLGCEGSCCRKRRVAIGNAVM